MKRITIWEFFSLLLFAATVQRAAAFVHPGVMLNQADLDRIKNHINVAPWSAAYAAFKANSMASSNYTMQGPFPFVSRNPDINRNALDNDSQAALYQALQWYITGNPTYANKAIAILNGWSGTLTNLTGTDVQLLAGDDGIWLCRAAEILRYSGAGWTQTGIDSFSGMMTNLFYPHLNPPGDANWGGSALKTMTAIGVFTDSTNIFDNAVDQFLNSPVASVTKNNLPIGENSESGRDAAHSAGGIWNLCWVAQVAWNQGLDLFSVGDNRLAAAAEYWCNYNLGNSPPFQLFGRASNGYVYTTNSSVDRGTVNWATAELSYSHYAILKGLYMPDNLAYRDSLEASPIDTLCFRVTNSPPAAPAQPMGVTAIDAGNRAIRVSWVAVPGATSYTIMRNVVGGNWPWGDVIADGITNTSYADANIAANSTHYYTVYADNAVARSAPSAQVSATTPEDSNWIAISAGNYYAEPPFQADAYFSGGGYGGPLAYKIIDMSDVASPPPMRVYEMLRWGTAFSYTIPGLTSGQSYHVRLHFAETTKTGTGQRIFDVYINGSPLLSNYDIFAAAGTNYKAVAQDFVATANANGEIVIAVSRVTDNAVLCGIEIRRVWTHADIGTVGMPGGSQFTNGVYAVSGSGSDINGTADACQFTYRTWTGDGTISTRLSGVDGGGASNDLAGLMIRDSTDAGSRMVSLLYDVGNGLARVAARLNVGGTVVWSNGPAIHPPTWLRIRRSGAQLISSLSPDGVTWRVVCTNSMALNQSLLVGFAVCSRNSSLGTATFDCISVSSNSVVSVPAPPTGLAGVGGNERATLSWNASSGATSYQVYCASASNGPFALVSTVPSVGFMEDGLTNGVTYYFEVRASNAAGQSANTAPIGVTPQYIAPPVTNAISLVNPGFELPGVGKISSGFDSPGAYDVPGWLDAGTTYADSGVESTASHGGSYHAYCDGGDSGAYQISGYQMQSGDVLTLKWWATTTGGSGAANPQVGLVSAAAATTLFPNTTTLVLTNNNLGTTTYQYVQYSLVYTATPADAGKYVGVYFKNQSPSGNWMGVDDISLTVVTRPPAPPVLTASAGDGRVELNWNAVSGATGYNLKRATASGGPYGLVATNLAALSYTDTTVSNGVLYYYVVSGTNALVEGPDSMPASARPTSRTPPALSSAMDAGNQLELAWPADHTGWSLQVQTNSSGGGLGTNWVRVANSDRTNQWSAPLDREGGSVFYRLAPP